LHADPAISQINNYGPVWKDLNWTALCSCSPKAAAATSPAAATPAATPPPLAPAEGQPIAEKKSFPLQENFENFKIWLKDARADVQAILVLNNFENSATTILCILKMFCVCFDCWV
jgi:hypothetical protein